MRDRRVAPAVRRVHTAIRITDAQLRDVQNGLMSEARISRRELTVLSAGEIETCRRALPAMRRARWGRIITIAGSLALKRINAATPAKAVITSWSRALSIQVAADGQLWTDQLALASPWPRTIFTSSPASL
jgi:NAD(P)-dependent dehydrogenase (short-subunit alcohol dehydrogenase family)